MAPEPVGHGFWVLLELLHKRVDAIHVDIIRTRLVEAERGWNPCETSLRKQKHLGGPKHRKLAPQLKFPGLRGCLCSEFSWENGCPSKTGETHHQGPVFIQTYKQLCTGGNIIQRMKACLECRIALCSWSPPPYPSPNREQQELGGGSPSLLRLGEGRCLASSLLSKDFLLQ